MGFIETISEWSTALLEFVGIGIIVFTSGYSLLSAAVSSIRKGYGTEVYRELRHRLGRSILLGLEFLVAADIVKTVSVNLSFRSLGILAVIVLIRTFLSFTLEVEIDGKWPWQRRTDA